ncbi:MAG: molybdopterin converting factor subunit 1 [Gammaproteobacteria bacterium]|nr:MAG: molybdopterin converting factor subunit 1 [Gammaproteobacteria bacterium]
MKVTVKYFASMRDRVGRAEDVVEIADGSTVADVWKQVAGDQDLLPNNTLIAVNMEYTDSKQTLKDGDELALFPPVTGG